ncbi:MAG TPA: SRPBCC family protein [Pilimelia sp.]|nr:SRPBCC family protein [Pilimelia sp.]
MVEFHETVVVDAPLADVVRVMNDVDRWPSWNAAVSRVSRPGSGPLKVGDTARVKQPRLPAATWTVTALDESGFGWTSSSLGVHSTGDHWAQDAGDGRTNVTLTLTLSGPLARITATAYSRLIRRYIRTEAEGLRREVERRPH